MALPGNVNTVRVRGYWFAQGGTGYSAGTIRFTPLDDDLTDMAAFAYIRTETVTVNPDPTTGYWFADLIATDDPDVTGFAWQVTRTDAGGAVVAQATIAVPYTAPTVDVGAGLMKQSVWLVDAATTTTPPTAAVYYTASQTDAAIATAVGGLVGGPVGDATTVGKGILRLAGDLSGTATTPTVPRLTDNYNLLVQEVVDRQLADSELQVEIGRRYEFDPAVGIPERDLSDGVVTKLNTVGSGGSSTTTTISGPTPQLSVGDRHIAEDAGIAESKVALASDASAATPSRRTLGTGPRQAMPGNRLVPVPGTDVPPLVGGRVPASFLPDGSVAGAPLNTSFSPSPLGIPTPGVDTRSSPADHVHPRPAVAQPADHGLLAWSLDPANATSSATASVGTLQLVRLWIPFPMTITGVILSAAAAGAGLTNAFTALFDSNRSLLAQSANRATAWGATTGDKKGDLNSPQAISAPGYVFAGWWVTGTTSPAWARSTTVGSQNNLNLTGGTLRFSTANIGLTATAPSTASTQTATASSFFVGLY